MNRIKQRLGNQIGGKSVARIIVNFHRNLRLKTGTLKRSVCPSLIAKSVRKHIDSPDVKHQPFIESVSACLLYWTSLTSSCFIEYLKHVIKYDSLQKLNILCETLQKCTLTQHPAFASITVWHHHMALREARVPRTQLSSLTLFVLTLSGYRSTLCSKWAKMRYPSWRIFWEEPRAPTHLLINDNLMYFFIFKVRKQFQSATEIACNKLYWWKNVSNKKASIGIKLWFFLSLS